MTRRSIRVAVLLPSMFAAVVIGAVVLEGRITVTAPIVAAGVPWNIGFALGWLALGLLLDVPLRWAGLPNPFKMDGYRIEAFLNCALIASPIINVFVLYVAGRGIDRAIEQRRRRSGTQP